jgi:hypothetical protein
MSKQITLALLFGAVATAGWSMAGRLSQAHPAWVGVVIMGLTAVWIVGRAWTAISTTSIAWWQLAVLVLAACLNGEAVYRVASVMADPFVRGGVFPLLLTGTSVLVGLLLGWVLLREVPTLGTLVYVGLIFAGVLGLMHQTQAG